MQRRYCTSCLSNTDRCRCALRVLAPPITDEIEVAENAVPRARFFDMSELRRELDYAVVHDHTQLHDHNA